MSDKLIDPFLFVIFGAGGDLSERKLMPALYHLMQRHDELRCCHVLGVARSERTEDEFRELIRQAFRDRGFTDEDLARWCDDNIYYQPLGDAGARNPALGNRIEKIERENGLPGNRVFYLALPPGGFAPTIEAIGEQGLHTSDGWTRLVVEKPFGQDLDSAQRLNELVHGFFSEEQVYRIDHYLGKETVQNLLVFRFANALFESVWNRDRIERVEIVVGEQLGVEGRGAYYDRSGAVRDMIQNHLTQLVCLMAMDAPSGFNAEAIRREKLKVLESISVIRPEDVVLGQYTAGSLNGTTVPGYLEEPGVPADSRTETFAELKLEISNWRWKGVPFVLRTGKRLPKRSTRIYVHFHPAPLSIFRPFERTCHLSPNVLVITLQPDEGFDLFFEVKEPGDDLHLVTQRLDFRYKEAFQPLQEAYETLILDVLEGDQTLFVDAEWVERSWKLYQPLLQTALPIHPYPAGSEGPAQRVST